MIESELRFKQAALVDGYEVIKGGWPDFILVKGDEIVLVEVKSGVSTHSKSLCDRQLRVMRLMENRGFTVRISDQGDLTRLYTIVEWLEKNPYISITNENSTRVTAIHWKKFDDPTIPKWKHVGKVG
jgi:hypothetical protein